MSERSVRDIANLFVCCRELEMVCEFAESILQVAKNDIEVGPEAVSVVCRFQRRHLASPGRGGRIRLVARLVQVETARCKSRATRVGQPGQFLARILPGQDAGD